jgi:DNA-binding CsgD family transcriptional regulator
MLQLVPRHGAHRDGSSPPPADRSNTRDKLLVTRRVALSPRERQLLGLLPQGLKNKEIAYKLGIAEGAVKVYLTRLFRKVGVNDRFELALFTLKNLSVHATGETTSERQSPEASMAAPGTGLFVPSFMTMERTRSLARS